MNIRNILSLSLAAVCATMSWGIEPAAPGKIQDEVGRAGMIAVLLMPNDNHGIPAVFLAGGANFPYAKPGAQTPAERGKKVFYDELTVLPTLVPGADGAATQPLLKGSMPRPLGYAAFAATDKGMVIAGGCNDDGHVNKVHRIELYGSELRTEALADLPRTVAYPAFALIGNKFYVIGGQEKADSTTCLNSCFVLDLSDVNAGWQELTPMPSGRMLAAAATFNGMIYVMGGCSLAPDEKGDAVRTYLNDVLCYDPVSNTWAKVSGEMPESVVGMANPLPVQGDKIYVVGGDPGDYYRASLTGQAPAQHPGQSKAIYSYAPATGTWKKEGELRQGVATFPAVQMDGIIYTISGETQPGVRTPVIDAFKAE